MGFFDDLGKKIAHKVKENVKTYVDKSKDMEHKVETTFHHPHFGHNLNETGKQIGKDIRNNPVGVMVPPNVAKKVQSKVKGVVNHVTGGVLTSKFWVQIGTLICIFIFLYLV